MPNPLIETVLKDAIKTVDDRASAITKELDHQREQYRKSVQPLEDELTELQDARARLTGEAPKGRAVSASGSGGSRRPRGQVKRAILDFLTDRPGATAGQVAEHVGGSKQSVTSSLQKMATDGQLEKVKLDGRSVGFRLPQ